jgi:hypothetical protein
MWHNTYEDHPVDELLSKENPETGKGLIGCQMKEINGWGEAQHVKKHPPSGMLKALIDFCFSGKK